MAHSNSTTNYNLPQFVSTDKPAWLTDVNTAYADIDTGMHAAKVAADNAQSDATQALTTAGEAATTAAGADSKGSGAVASLATAFDTTATYSVGDIVIYNNLLYVCSVDVVTPGPWSGSANWNRTTVAASISGLNASDIAYNLSDSVSDAMGDITQLTTTDKTNIVDAINEVNGKTVPEIKYTTTNVTFDAGGEGLLTGQERIVLMVKDLTGGSTYVGYVPYLSGGFTYIKSFNRSIQGWDSNVRSTTRSVGYYYIE